MHIIIQKAVTSDSEILTAITKKSKAYWGYSEKQMEIWSELLTITETYIETRSVYKLIIEDVIVGYYSFYNKEGYIVKLDNLFIHPHYIGQGYGKILMADFLLRLKGTGAKKIILESEPNAGIFYAKMGFVKTGQNESSIKDRFLPVMELNIKAG
jgi:GNAT superfamily N-acetyltransferase